MQVSHSETELIQNPPQRIEPYINILPSDRVLIIGTSGSGKSYRTRRILLPRYAVRPVVFDPKERWFDDERGGKIVSTFKRGAEYQIIRLPDYDESDGPELWDEQAQRVLRDAPHTLIIDELTLVTGTRTFPRGIGRILRTGREVGDNKGNASSVGLWMLTQQPAYIPTAAYALANHKFIFMQERDDDIIRIGRETTKEIIPYVRRLHKRDYVYYNREKGLLIPVRVSR
jgi:hypothetical protein